MAAIPFYLGSMELERRALARRRARSGPSAADYEARDSRTSLTMGTASLLAPIVLPKLLGPIVPGRGRYAKALVGTAVVAAAATTVADVVARRASRADDETGPHQESQDQPSRRDRRAARARRVAAVAGPVAVATGGVAITTALASKLTARRLWDRRLLPDLGNGPGALALAAVGWDFIYYLNHRFMHESRYMWAIHVVHHSSERYNLSTALRQPVAEAFGTPLPYGLLCLAGIRPELVGTARGINLIYQYWIHTDTIRSLGPLEEVLNTPSHHRVHHGSNPEYLDRNHAGILILWDRLLGTFRRETEPVVYGLTRNIDTFNPLRVASHEHVAMLRDVARSDNWRDRLGFVVRGPGWANARRREMAQAPAALAAAAAV